MKSNHLDVQYNPRMVSSCLTILEFNYFHLNKSICFECFIICLYSATLLLCTF